MIGDKGADALHFLAKNVPSNITEAVMIQLTKMNLIQQIKSFLNVVDREVEMKTLLQAAWNKAKYDLE